MMHYSLDARFENIVDHYWKNHPEGDLQKILRAYEFASMMHGGVYRGSGEPYINHAIRAARTVAEWGFGSNMICAALLHDVVEDCDVSLEEISDRFGPAVAQAVDTVTALSDRDFTDSGRHPTKVQMDTLSDARLQKKMDFRALFVKVADRIDNLNTLDGVPEAKRIPKALHTREILIPMVMLAGSYFCVDLLEELCFQIEHPDIYAEIENRCRIIRIANRNKCHESLDFFARIFDPAHNNAQEEMEVWHAHIRNFRISHRLPVSIFRQITSHADNIELDLKPLINKETLALYDLFLTVDDSLGQMGAPATTRDLFFQYFANVLSKEGFHVAGYSLTTHKDASYYILADSQDNLYRLFIKTEEEAKRYLYGNSMYKGSGLSITDVNEIEPRDTYNRKIKVFRRNGAAMMIDEHATALDMAFHVNPALGLHFHYALINSNATHLPPYTRLNDGDKVAIVTDESIEPAFSWFRCVKTSRATDLLVRYFEKIYNQEGTVRKGS